VRRQWLDQSTAEPAPAPTVEPTLEAAAAAATAVEVEVPTTSKPLAEGWASARALTGERCFENTGEPSYHRCTSQKWCSIQTRGVRGWA
jgi:hypothetical protein